MPDNTEYLMPNVGAEHNPVSSLPDGQAVSDLNNLLDVLVPAPTDGQVLTFKASDGKWEAVSPGDSSVTAPLTLTGSTDAVQLAVKGNSTQTSSLLTVLDHAGTHGLTVFSNGEVSIASSGSDGLIMGGKQITNMANGDDATDAVTFGQFSATGWQGTWSGATTYAASAIVVGSDSHCYIGLSAANLNHDPTTDDGVHWQALNS